MGVMTGLVRVQSIARTEGVGDTHITLATLINKGEFNSGHVQQWD